MVKRKNPKSQKLCSPAAELIGGNDSLLDLIFPRLPVRSLTRFKSVSKQWCALISDTQFGRSHTVGNPSSCIPSGLYLYSPVCFLDNTVLSISLNELGAKIPSCSDPVELPDNVPIKLMQFLPEKNIMRMVQSCNGLYLFRFNAHYTIDFYCVRNVVTNQLKLVPMPKLNAENYDYIVTCCLAFDPLVSPHFKVICVQGVTCPSRRRNMSKFLIFSSETGQWVDTSVTLDGTKLAFAKGEYCNGAIYWILENKLICYRFDIDAENLTQISVPPQARGSNFRHFGGSCGHLYLAGVRDNTAKILNVYELDLVKMKWYIKHWVHIDRLISSLPQVIVNGENQMCHSTKSILGVLRGERDEDSSALITSVFGTVVSYNFKSKKVEVLLSELPWKDDNRSIFSAFGEPPFVPAYPLIPSLHPLDGWRHEDLDNTVDTVNTTANVITSAANRLHPSPSAQLIILAYILMNI